MYYTYDRYLQECGFHDLGHKSIEILTFWAYVQTSHKLICNFNNIQKVFVTAWYDQSLLSLRWGAREQHISSG